jgi:hypothetical protein
MKPRYRYICEKCGFRTQKPWRFAAHKHKPKRQVVSRPVEFGLKDIFVR